ncbi:protein kinase domain-containing protein [Paracidovorax wautersii]|uniref:Serine/threonine protein phosphatase PrpC n=1 Tax=Paracidovorax wautersii TaxID=1177982 RepID=A0ABU1IBB7_9BURK|nr:protein kinase [Paracidovorax wautersii]MDR6214467.1 serine/threonine protein phosphatase PrpC [Paracidovorax wautersii]
MNAPLPQVSLGQCSLGKEGGTNQDFHGARVPDGYLRTSKGLAVAMADGIGSSPVSQVASAAAVRSFLDDYFATSEAWSVRRAAQRVLQATNSWLHAQNQRGDARFNKDCGYVCTFSALLLKGRQLHLLHVGDGRVFRVHTRALEQLTEDHRVQVSSSESYLARALGVAAHLEIDYAAWEAEAGEVYLLATDGAHAFLDAEAVSAALAAHADDLDAAAAALARLARTRGSTDDITVQLLRIDTLPQEAGLQASLQRDGMRLPGPLAPRSVFEGYAIVRELHVSPRSHVYLAIDEATGIQVALKTPAVDRRDDAGYLDRFLLDEWVARRVDSPHVVRAHVADRPRTHLFVAMEYIEGQTLAQWMVDHPRPDLVSVRSLALQIAAGLHALHRREMLHQDLRPANVMIDPSGTARLIDLASTHVAGLVESGEEVRARALMGTLQYTAPEYFLDRGGDERSDLFSLAVLCYQMLTGQLPYGLQPTQLRGAADLRRLRYVPLRHHRPDLPGWLDGVLQKALHPDPARRQQAVSELAHDLQSPGPTFQHRRVAPPLAERNPVAFWQAISAVLALAVCVLLALLSRSGT